jgi:predicted DNA-binding transcriptional regulator AlpA
VDEEDTRVPGRIRPTLPEVEGWPASVDVPTAATAFGISRSHAYELVARGEFPAKVIRVGTRYRVITASIVNALSDDAAIR